MMHRVEIFRDDKRIVVIRFLKISHLSVNTNRIYDLPKLKSECVNYASFRKSGNNYTYSTEIIKSDF